MAHGEHQPVNMQNFHELIHGFHNFKEEYFLQEKEFFDRLSHGQSPKTLVIACCDSRVDPAILLGCRPGDLFVVRNIAALVPEEGKGGTHDAVMAAVEYGVKHLKVNHIIVMGHSSCGGIHALMHPEAVENEAFIKGWVSIASPVLEELEAEVPDETEHSRHRRCEEGAVLMSIDNLLSYHWVQEAVTGGTLALHALYYDMKDGHLFIWNAEKEDFECPAMYAKDRPEETVV